MNKFAWTAGFVACAAILMTGCSATSTVTVTSSPPATTPSTVTVSSSPPATTPSTVNPAAFTVCITPAVGCAGELKTEPAQIIVTGDSSEFVRNLTWSGWGSATAQGNGTMEVDNCSPSCAQGTLTGYPAMITVTNPIPYGSGLHAYADMVVSSPASPFGTKSYSHLAPS